ncbi:MAG: ABC transporter permease [Alphaproteobacteria bacterium]|nr:ABC transporter permease [Alphaproteobacteria bacterium]
MHPVLVVARREFVQRVFRWGFLLLTFGLPALWLGMTFAAVAVQDAARPEPLDIVVVDATGQLRDALVRQLRNDDDEPYRVVDAPDGDTSPEALDQAVLDHRIDGWVLLDDGSLATGALTLRALAFPGLERAGDLEHAIYWAAIRQRLGGDDPAIDALLDGGSVAFVDLDEPERGDQASAVEQGNMLVAAGGALVLYLTILFYPVQLLMSVVEEKLNGLVELLLCSVRPWQLLLGKVLGVGSAGLLQLAIWTLPELAVMVLLRGHAATLPPEQRAVAEGVLDALPGVDAFAVLGACFLFGFFFYATLFAAVGALCSSEKDAELAQSALSMSTSIMALPLLAVFRDPDSVVATALSFVPPFTPFLLFSRYVLGAPVWQIGTALALLVASTFGMALLAGRVYRIGVLAQGTRPTPRELWRWVRTG